MRKWFQWKVGEGSQVLRVSGGDVQRGNGSTRCRGTRDWRVKLDRASGASENIHTKKLDERIMDNGGERAPTRRRMKEPEREGLIWRQMP